MSDSSVSRNRAWRRSTGSLPLSQRTKWPGDFGNWNRWDDERGTLNLIGPAKVLNALSTVRDGLVLPLAPALSSEPYPEELQRLYGLEPFGYRHEMYPIQPGAQSANDKVTLALHRRENAHIDALSHVAHQGRGFNGLPFDAIVDNEGAKHFDVTQMLGIVTRAVVVDVPALRGVPYLEPGDSIMIDDLLPASRILEPGDAVLVRTGNARVPPTVREARSGGDPHQASAGIHLDAMELVADLDVGVLGTDSTGDTYPMPFPDKPSIHAICEVYLGIPLLHGLDLDRLVDACRDRDREAVLLMIAALHISGGTGSPVTPLAVL